MFRNKVYYGIKPLVPTTVRLGIRRWLAQKKRARTANRWPIMPGSEQPPEGWPGWPEGKQFALVLTHDVEGASGLAKVRPLVELESQLGFRSSFNLIPEGGEYSASKELREELQRNGFEVGVHDLHHNGKLFLNAGEYNRNAAKINHYLQDWGVAGFRSGFMLRNLDWIHELNVQYDASTFDTDPFEPQPNGCHTIFPFWVARSSAERGVAAGGEERSDHHPRQSGYVELPYTLPQDSTLFLLLGEQQPDVWLQKLDWIAAHGGMVLLDTHPDYMSINGAAPKAWEYPASHYQRFLAYVRSRYAGKYWHALPREVAEYLRGSTLKGRPPVSANRSPAPPAHRQDKPKIWIDLDNTPHVPFFEPILEELQARGYPVLVTARDAFQVCELADQKGLRYTRIGRHSGKNRLLKATGLASRALQLAPVVRREKPALGISHGARSQLLLGNWLHLPTILLEDYEYCQFPPMMRPTWIMAPTVIPDASLIRAVSRCACWEPWRCLCRYGRIRKYPGIKESVYAWKLTPDPGALKPLGVQESDLLVTARPPATEAHYHNPESERLFEAFMNRACQTPRIKIVLLPRNKKQADQLRHQWPQWFEGGKTVIPAAALDGLNLIWQSDLVVSGGGTMNREAAALDVPVYSIFRGTIGAVDRYLQAEGRLVLIESIEDVRNRINLAKRARKPLAEVTTRRTLENIVDTIEELAASVSRRPTGVKRQRSNVEACSHLSTTR